MNKPIRYGKWKSSDPTTNGAGRREILRGKSGRILGRFENDTGITRDASGQIVGRGENQLLKLLK
jgi:hypothetical protein